MRQSENEELMQLTRQLLNSIVERAWETYERLSDAAMTAFEPEAGGQMIVGLPFHRFYFDSPQSGRRQSTICSPQIRVMGDVAVVAYVRLDQCIKDDGVAHTQSFLETRVWQKQDSAWKQVHFHRSDAGRT